MAVMAVLIVLKEGGLLWEHWVMWYLQMVYMAHGSGRRAPLHNFAQDPRGVRTGSGPVSKYLNSSNWTTTMSVCF